jgi:hypothetical protein
MTDLCVIGACIRPMLRPMNVTKFDTKKWVGDPRIQRPPRECAMNDGHREYTPERCTIGGKRRSSFERTRSVTGLLSQLPKRNQGIDGPNDSIAIAIKERTVLL